MRLSLKELEQVQEEQQKKVMGLIKPILSQLKEVARMYVYDRSDTKGKRLAENEELLERIILKYHEEEQEYEQLAQTAEASDVIQRVKGVMNMVGEDIYFRSSTLYSPHNFSKPFIDKVELELDAIKNKDK
ncbi:hypothetical protein NHG33_08520 [Aerococcaceae bacterium NML130460]|nr:hypothetical protein [Aerococcaceae bacterium NML130460]